MFNVPSTARSFRDGTPIYCPLRRTWSSINTPFRPGIEPRAVAWQSITLPLRYASSMFFCFFYKRKSLVYIWSMVASLGLWHHSNPHTNEAPSVLIRVRISVTLKNTILPMGVHIFDFSFWLWDEIKCTSPLKLVYEMIIFIRIHLHVILLRRLTL